MHSRASDGLDQRLVAELRSDDFESRKISAIAGRIAGEQDEPRDRRVGADVEVRQRGSAPAASPPVSDEALTGEEGRLPRQRKTQEVLRGEGVLEILDALEADRNLGVDQRVDRERRALGGGGERLARPRGPLRILGEDVEQDVAIDEDGQRSPRVSARIWPVVIRTVPRPRNR